MPIPTVPVAIQVLSALRSFLGGGDPDDLDDVLLAPARGHVWYCPKGNDEFALRPFAEYPVLAPGDMVGIHPSDPVPVAPVGMQLLQLEQPEKPGVSPRNLAIVYRVHSRGSVAERARVTQTLPRGTGLGVPTS